MHEQEIQFPAHIFTINYLQWPSGYNYSFTQECTLGGNQVNWLGTFLPSHSETQNTNS